MTIIIIVIITAVTIAAAVNCWDSRHFKLVKRITASVRQEIALGHCKDHGYLNMS